MSFLKGLGCGAGLMYWFDARQGRRRRARLRDRGVHLAHCASDFVDRGLRDLTNRLNGVVHDARCLFAADEADDRTIEERVRAKLGRYVSHPHAIQAAVHEGRVILSGPVLADEVDDLLAAVESVRGVQRVESRLDVHEDAGNISALQGGVEPGREPFDLVQENWSPATRLVACGVGTALMLNCLARRTPGAILLGTLGFGLFARGSSNMPASRLVGLGDGRKGFTFHKAYHIEAPVERVFDFLTDWEGSARFMPHVKHIRNLGDGRLRWTLHAPGGADLELEEVVTEVEPNRLIAWTSTDGSPIGYEGRVRFEPESDRRTLVDVWLTYRPPAGAVGHAAAALVGWDPKTQMEQSFVRIKSFLETGKVPHDVERALAREHQESRA
ncbi:MAG TPA: SRPBCC family protein [Planctomycetaceae bacterium]|nr:SRPBCC family protein [Planctomycetaceae bacterium]